MAIVKVYVDSARGALNEIPPTYRRMNEGPDPAFAERVGKQEARLLHDFSKKSFQSALTEMGRLMDFMETNFPPPGSQQNTPPPPEPHAHSPYVSPQLSQMLAMAVPQQRQQQ